MKQVVVIGLGQFGTHLARTLVRMDCEVLVLDRNDARVAAVKDDVHRAVVGDARDLETLERVLNDSIDEAIVNLGESSIEPSILCVLHLKKIGVPCVRSTARNDDHAAILQAVGADELIFPERDTAERVARQIANPHVRDMFPLSEDYRIIEITAPKKLVGKTLGEAHLRKEYDVLVLAVRTPGDQTFRYLPQADTLIQEGEELMMLGRELDLARIAAME